MKKFTFKSIRTRLTFWFLVLGLAPLFFGTLITYNQQVRSIKQATFDKLVAIRDLKVQHLENWIGEKESWMKSVSEDKEFRDLEQFFQKKELNKPDDQILENMRRILKRNLGNFDDFFELLIINAYSRKVIVSTNSDVEGMDENKDPSLTEFLAIKNFHIKDIHLCQFHNDPAMAFAIPIHCTQHHGKHIIGVLVGRVHLEKSLYVLLSNRIGLGKTGETLIVNKDVKALNELRWHENAPLNLKIQAEPALNASRGETGIIGTLDYRGKNVLAAYTYIPETEWGFICKQDMYELNAPIRRLSKNLAVLFIISAIMIFLIVFWVSKKISKPIVDMDIATQKIKDGDYSVRNTVRSADELGSLADSINATTASIESYSNIKKGVADISETMIGRSSIKEFGSELLKQLMEITKSNMCAFYILNEEKFQFEHFTSVGANKELLNPFDAQNPEGEFGYAVSNKKINYIQNIPEDTIFQFKTTAGEAIPKEIITVPILVENKIIAIISLANLNQYSRESIDILKQSWDLINSSYSNLSANAKTKKLAENLTKTNQQLEAQAEELQSQTEELQSQSEEIQQTSEELQEQNVELEAQREQVEEASRLKSEFLSNMSHELRTPLNSVMALSKVLMSQAGDKLSREELNYLEIIGRNGKNLLSLINDILDLSKIEAGKMDIRPKLFSISYLIESIIERLEPVAGEKGIALDQQGTEDLPQIENDEAMVHQIIQNIIGNAVKFTEKGSVSISAYSDAEKIVLTIADTGIGIAKKDLPHIFEEFRQVDGTSSRSYEGTGLGLTLAYKSAILLDGDLTVESIPGKGSVFTLVLPIKGDGIVPPLEKIPAARKTVPALDDKPDVISDNRILVVEDNEAAIIQVRKMLESESYRVDLAYNGNEALEYLGQTIPDGIILDLMMPGMDGFELINKIRANEATAKIPVLVLTAKALTRQDYRRLNANNIQQLIQKGDVDREELLHKLRGMLGIGDEGLGTGGGGSKTGNLKLETEKPGARKPSGGTEGKPATILVVEDNPDSMTTIKAILPDQYTVLEATDGETALKTIFNQPPDLVLLDISLPKMNGYEVIRKIRQDKRSSHIPVIALSASAMKGDREKILEAGCDDYLSKPLEAEELLKKIGEWLGT